ncbi:MAG: L-aspartate oxidase [Bacteroidetes bacterium]|nr:L-aspartate oxidase [Bacteroidota bacterium]
MQVLEFDTVVIGSGLAGLTTALYASQFGKVAIITKSGLDISNSYNAQGGIAAAIGEGDSVESHLFDSMLAGRGLCDEEAMKVLVNEGIACVLDLIKMGMPFDGNDGEIILGLEGGHSKRRILHAEGDATGKVLTRFMLERIKAKENIQAFENTTVVDLLITNNICNGVKALEFRTQKNLIFKANAVVIATGGLARIYSRTTNPHTATGDGYALGFQAGAQLADMEFIQFHPTALHLDDKDAFLISEAVRGEGAYLINENGERFMSKIHELAELAPRDVVSFAIFKEIQKSKSEHVFLSLRHLDSSKIKQRFSHIYSKLKEFGLDLTKDNIPVAPAAHYTVGGIKTDLHGHTSVENLFAAGEVASTGVMGANRIASNSLLECLVFGKRTGIAAGNIRPKAKIDFDDTIFKLDTENEMTFLEKKNQIALIMSNFVGIVRNKKGLVYAINEIQKIRDEFTNCTNKYNLCKINNNAEICLLIARAALEREESRGGHIREDFRNENPDFRVHSVQQKGKNIQFEPIRKK